VKYEKRGRKKFFRISDNHVKNILNQGLIHIGEDVMDVCSDEIIV
jgi:hypothetical protein